MLQQKLLQYFHLFRFKLIFGLSGFHVHRAILARFSSNSYLWVADDELVGETLYLYGINRM
jgi:hypothetical protein